MVMVMVMVMLMLMLMLMLMVMVMVILVKRCSHNQDMLPTTINCNICPTRACVCAAES